jgi:acyl carrier protein
MTSAAGVKEAVKTFILEEFLPGENPDELNDSVELMTAGILDSVAILKMVAFLEDRYKVTFAPHELDKQHMNTLESIAQLVSSKMK